MHAGVLPLVSRPIPAKNYSPFNDDTYLRSLINLVFIPKGVCQQNPQWYLFLKYEYEQSNPRLSRSEYRYLNRYMCQSPSHLPTMPGKSAFSSFPIIDLI